MDPSFYSTFLDLGIQPLANSFLDRNFDSLLDEKKYQLSLTHNSTTGLVSLKEQSIWKNI